MVQVLIDNGDIFGVGDYFDFFSTNIYLVSYLL